MYNNLICDQKTAYAIMLSAKPLYIARIGGVIWSTECLLKVQQAIFRLYSGRVYNNKSSDGTTGIFTIATGIVCRFR